MSKENTKAVDKEPKFYGKQLLRMDKYKTTIAKTVIKPDRLYSFNEADQAINNTLRKRG